MTGTVYKDRTPAVLYEMMRSFTALARTKNVAATVEEVGATRQTVKRHIDELERITGRPLFVLKDRQYALTEAGEAMRVEADAILQRTDAWLKGFTSTVRELNHVIFHDSEGVHFFAQQHPLSRVWRDSAPIMQKALAAWANAGGRLEHRAMAKIRPHLVVYRDVQGQWFCVEVGEKSSLASWLGWTWAKSAVGCLLIEDPMHTEADRFVLDAYSQVFREGSARLDHVSTRLRRRRDGPRLSLNYQRLLFSCTLPDGTPTVATLVDRTNKIDIAGVSEEKIASLSKTEGMK